MRKYGFGLICCVIVSLVAFSFTTHAVDKRTRQRSQPQAPEAIQLQPFITTGLSSPLYLTSARDGTNRIFIVEQGGIIKVVQPGSNVTANFLNITPKVLSGGERGLLGLAFHPDYEINRRFFVNYTRQTDGATVISEFRTTATNPNLGDAASEKVLLVIAQPFANHNGGWIDFGFDGYLYIGMGDGGSANDPGNRAQNINELLGKILRIDVDHPNGSVPYSSPPSNPFFTTAGSDEIYAVGMRNPYRDSFDRQTGQLFSGDVGQGQREEVDIITLGGNFGWRVFEGTLCTGLGPASCTASNYVAPITEYSHTGGRCSLTGGYVYRGPAGTLPFGAYLFGDYCTGEIFQLNPAAAGGTQTLLLDTTRNISSFGEDEAGEIYVVNLNGTIDLIVSSPSANCSPTASTSNQSFSPAGGAGNVQVTNTTCGWSASSNVSWITFPQNSNSGTGPGTATFNVAPNTGEGIRTGTVVVAGRIISITQVGHQRSDFDGEGKTDLAIWRPSTGQWFITNSLDNSARVQQWGISTDIIVPGDYDGDGKTDIAVFRPSEGNWYIIQSTTGSIMLQGWGSGGDVPVRGDFDGDGKTDIAVYRPSEGNWYIRNSGGGPITLRQWGTSEDRPVPGDYDADGKADIAVFRPSEGTWYVLRSSGGVTVQGWGNGTDVLVPGDYDGDGRTDIAVYRPSEGNWYLIQSANGITLRNWGASGDVPVPGDYDGDKRTDIAVFRPSEGNWYILNSGGPATLRNMGLTGDKPVPSAYTSE